MVAGVDGEVADYVVEAGHECYVSRVESGSVLCESGSGIGTAIDDYGVGQRLGVVGDADLACAVSRDPLSVIDWDACSSRIDRPCGTAVLAGADVDVDKWRVALEACYVDVEEPVGISSRRYCYIGVPSCRRDTYSSS